MRECVALLSDKQFEDHHSEAQDVACELQGDDRNGRPYKMVTVIGLPPGFAESNNFKSGVTTIFADAQIDDTDDTLHITDLSTIQVNQTSPFLSIFLKIHTLTAQPCHDSSLEIATVTEMETETDAVSLPKLAQSQFWQFVW
jgi:hypothetical protein